MNHRSAFLRDSEETFEVSSQVDNANTIHTGANPEQAALVATHARNWRGPAGWRRTSRLKKHSLDESLPAVDGRFRQILRESRQVGNTRPPAGDVTARHFLSLDSQISPVRCCCSSSRLSQWAVSEAATSHSAHCCGNAVLRHAVLSSRATFPFR